MAFTTFCVASDTDIEGGQITFIRLKMSQGAGILQVIICAGRRVFLKYR